MRRTADPLPVAAGEWQGAEQPSHGPSSAPAEDDSGVQSSSPIVVADRRRREVGPIERVIGPKKGTQFFSVEHKGDDAPTCTVGPPPGGSATIRPIHTPAQGRAAKWAMRGPHAPKRAVRCLASRVSRSGSLGGHCRMI